jgi:hypothetical protein
MVMANGQVQGRKLNFKKRAISHENRPDAPEGHWEVLIPKGKCKADQTPPDKGADPFITIAFTLVKAHDEKNESFQNSQITQRLTFYDQADPDRRKAANANLRFAQGLAEACELELKDVFPDEVAEEQDLTDIIAKLEGKRFEIWTVHRESVMGNGEKTINVDIRFKEPGSGLRTQNSDADPDDEDRPGRRPAAGGKSGKRR